MRNGLTWDKGRPRSATSRWINPVWATTKVIPTDRSNPCSAQHRSPRNRRQEKSEKHATEPERDGGRSGVVPSDRPRRRAPPIPAPVDPERSGCRGGEAPRGRPRFGPRRSPIEPEADRRGSRSARGSRCTWRPARQSRQGIAWTRPDCRGRNALVRGRFAGGSSRHRTRWCCRTGGRCRSASPAASLAVAHSFRTGVANHFSPRDGTAGCKPTSCGRRVRDDGSRE